MTRKTTYNFTSIRGSYRGPYNYAVNKLGVRPEQDISLAIDNSKRFGDYDITALNAALNEFTNAVQHMNEENLRAELEAAFTVVNFLFNKIEAVGGDGGDGEGVNVDNKDRFDYIMAILKYDTLLHFGWKTTMDDSYIQLEFEGIDLSVFEGEDNHKDTDLGRGHCW